MPTTLDRPRIDVKAELAGLRQFKKDGAWLQRHLARLRKKYQDEFVAVYRERVIAHDKDLRRLCSRLRKRSPEAPLQAVVEYLLKDPPELIL